MLPLANSTQRNMLAAYSHTQALSRAIAGDREAAPKADSAEKAAGARPVSEEASANAYDDAQAYAVLPAQKAGSAGLYSVKKDPQGKREIVFDKPARYVKEIAATLLNAMPEIESPRTAPADSAQKPGADGAEGTQTIANTDRVDQEIEGLKNKQAQLEKRLAAASAPERRAALQNELKRLRSQLAMKDNDTYRKQNTDFSTTAQ